MAFTTSPNLKIVISNKQFRLPQAFAPYEWCILYKSEPFNITKSNGSYLAISGEVVPNSPPTTTTQYFQIKLVPKSVADNYTINNIQLNTDSPTYSALSGGIVASTGKYNGAVQHYKSSGMFGTFNNGSNSPIQDGVFFSKNHFSLSSLDGLADGEYQAVVLYVSTDANNANDLLGEIKEFRVETIDASDKDLFKKAVEYKVPTNKFLLA